MSASTSWHVYGIVGRPVVVGAGDLRCGAFGERLEVLSAGDGNVHAIAGLLHEPPRPTVEAIRGHDRVLRTAAGLSGAVVPMRFGQTFRSREQVVEALVDQQPRLKELLAHVSGAVQMTVRIQTASPTAGPQADAGPGTRYLASRRAAGADAEVAAVREACREFAREMLVETARERARPWHATLYCLVPREKLSDWRRSIASLTHVHLAISGPWPPYAFVEWHSPAASEGAG